MENLQEKGREEKGRDTGEGPSAALLVSWSVAEFEAMKRRAETWPALKSYAEAREFVQWIRTQPGSEHWTFEALEDGRVSLVFIGPVSLLVETESLGLTDGSSSRYAQVQEALFSEQLFRRFPWSRPSGPIS